MTHALSAKSRVAVVGVGLIGASFALALKQAFPGIQIVGVDREPASVEKAVALHIVDREATLPEAAAWADLALFAAPVGQLQNILVEIKPHLQPNIVLTDAGSTKGDAVQLVRLVLEEQAAQFVPGHPIAGRETSGVGAADGELFRGKKVVLTPLANNSASACDMVASAWAACGAEVMRLSPEEHDAVFAAVSHLPHVLAFALVDELAGRSNAQTLFSFAASGFRDFTRIAGSSPEMWRDIALSNKRALLAEIGAFQAKMSELAAHIERDDATALSLLMQRAQTARAQWLAGTFDEIQPDATP